MNNKILATLTLLACSMIPFVVSCGSDGNDYSGTASEVVTTASISGTLVKGSELQTQSMKVELYLTDSSSPTGLKKTSTTDSLIGSLTTSSGLFQFTSLPAGNYRIAVVHDSVSVGGMDGIAISTGQALQITIEITIIIQQIITINTTNNISIQNIYVENGLAVKNADGSYNFLIPEDSSNVAVTVSVNDAGISKTVEANLVKQDDGSYTLVLPDDSGLEATTIVGVSSSSIQGLSNMGYSSSFLPSSSSGSVVGNCPAYNSTSSFCDTRDGQVYRYTIIGNQKWMAENLNYSGHSATGSRTFEKGWCYGVADTSMHQDSVTCENANGRAYNWVTAMNLPKSCEKSSCANSLDAIHQGVCPDNWHVPTDDDWKQLEMAAGMPSDTANKTGEIRGYEGILLKSESVSSTGSIEAGAYDIFGFSAILSGNMVGNTRKWADRGAITFFWTASENGSVNAWYRMLSISNADIARNSNATKTDGFSVRCISNEVVVQKAECTNTYEKDQFTDCRDGQTYKTKLIGTQTWMAENLRYNKFGSTCPNDVESNCETYGRLYDGYASLYACPIGWHVPSNPEWLTLVETAGGESVAGSKLKSTSGWTSSAGISSTDEYGFTGLPAGGYGTFGRDGSWWAVSSSIYSVQPKLYGMHHYTNAITMYQNGWFGQAVSLRCLKD